MSCYLDTSVLVPLFLLDPLNRRAEAFLRKNRDDLVIGEFGATYKDLPFRAEAVDGVRYKYENTAYSYADAIYLCSMIRHAKPNRIVEVGSGFSSCVTLDTNELWFSNSIESS